MKFLILILSLTTTFALEFEAHKLKFYQRIFPELASYELIKVPDPISEIKINTKIFKVFDKSKNHLGYIRKVKTTTGCNSACLPVIFTLFYDKNKNLLKLLSKAGLTKKGHAPFTADDYQKLELTLALNPEIFKKVNHPTEMVDILSGATKKEYQDHVVKEAAYSTLRINLYNQQTLEFLKSLK